MNRLFSTFFDDNGGSTRRWAPAMDLMEKDDHLVLRADLPGLSEDDVRIEVQDNVLTVSGDRKTEHEDKGGGYYRVERAFGSFSRSVTLPQGIDAEKIDATFDKGVLEVRIPKPEERKPHRIAIGGGSEDVEGTATEKK
jgi:HSP20 family protein